MPFRVEDAKSVDGPGKFRVQDDTVWFWPMSGGTGAHEWMFGWTKQKPVIGFAVAAGACLILALVLGGTGIWSFLTSGATNLGDVDRDFFHEQIVRKLSVGCFIVAALAVLQSWQPLSLKGAFVLRPDLVFREAGDDFYYRLPHWIRIDRYRDESVKLFENGKPLKRVDTWLWGSQAEAGIFCVAPAPWRVSFRASDGSNPVLNGRSYRLSAAVFPPQNSLRLAVLLVFFGVVALIYTRGIAQVRLPWPFFRRAGWVLVMVLLGVLKLWVIAGDEILAEENDAFSYASSTIGLVWFGGGWLPSHPTGFPLLAGLFAQFGMPWRLALEIMYLLACGGLAMAVRTLLSSRTAAVALFAVMAWHPWTLAGFRDFMAYPVLLIATIVLLTLCLCILNRPSSEWRIRWFVGMGLVLFLWDQARHEEPLVLGTWALFGIIAWWLTTREANPPCAGRRIRLLLLPLVLLLALSTLALWADYYRFGVYAKSLIRSPGVTALMKALYRVKPEQNLRYAPVTRQSLQAACRVSPSLQPFESALLDPKAPSTRFGEQVTGAPGEFGTWLNWLLVQTLGDPRISEELMLKAAKEIQTALKEGRLPSRHSYFPLDPNWQGWLPDLGKCVTRCIHYAASLEPWKTWVRTDRPDEERVFDEAASRRSANAADLMMLGEGTVAATSEVVDAVALADTRGQLLGASPLATNVALGLPAFRLRVPLRIARRQFVLQFFHGGQLRYSERLISDSAEEYSVERADVSAALLDGSGDVTYSCKFVLAHPAKLNRLKPVERYARNVGLVLTILAVALAVAGVLKRQPWERVQVRRLAACLLMVTGWLAGRVLLYGLLEANMGWGAERYMRCVSPLFILLLVLGSALIPAAILSRKRPKVLLPEEQKAEVVV